ncbi:MAG: hypothetical protein ACPG52_10230 [Cognaticolwellia sp.]
MESHGSYELTHKDQTVIVKAIGAWNYETALIFVKEYKQLVRQLSDKPWACLVDLTQWELFAPDVARCINKVNIWANVNNQKYEVVVCGLSIQQPVLEKTHQVFTNVETMFCDNLAQAYHWLETLDVTQNDN